MPGRGWARHGDGEARSLEPTPEGARRRERPRPGPSGAALRAALPGVLRLSLGGGLPGRANFGAARCEAGGHLGLGRSLQICCLWTWGPPGGEVSPCPSCSRNSCPYLGCVGACLCF